MRINFFIFILILSYGNVSFQFCLSAKDRVKWIRAFHYDDNQGYINIEVSPRPSHQIVSFITKILLQERLGYKNITMHKVKWDTVSDAVERLSFPESGRSGKNPQSHINMEVLMSPGYSLSEKIKQNVIDCGPLGPSVRKGIFIQSNLSYILKNYIIGERWQNIKWSTQYNHSNVNLTVDDKIGFQNTFDIVKQALFHQLNVEYVKSTVINQALLTHRPHDIILNWYPNIPTVRENYERVLYSDCWNSLEPVCEFEVQQVTKVVWKQFKTYAEKAFKLINEFQLTQQDYIDLLKKVNLTVRNEEKEYERIACEWITKNKAKWYIWTKNWNVKDKLYLPVFISEYGPWKSIDPYKASLMRVNDLNTRSMNNTQIEIVPILKMLRCNKDDVINAYLSVVEEYDKQILGCIVCLCPKSYETVIKISDMENRILISSSIESANNMNFTDHYFTTLPNMRYYNLVLIKMLKKFNWKRVVVLKKDDHLIDIQELRRHNIEVLAIFDKKENQVTYNETLEFLKNSKTEHKATIFIVDYNMYGVQTVMCAAGILKMTFRDGYVFILGPFIDLRWWMNSSLSQCEQNPLMISKEYFIIKHDTTSEHRKTYQRIMPGNKYNQYLAQLTSDAIDYMGSSFRQLLRQEPSAHLNLNSPKISRKFIDLLVNMTDVILGWKTEYIKRVFDSKHNRIGNWHIQQAYCHSKPGQPVILTIYNWHIDLGFDPITKLPKISQLKNSKFSWGSLDRPFPDTNEKSDCVVETFRSKIGISCIKAIFLINGIVLIGIILFLAIILMVFYRRQQQLIPDDVNKKPFEDLCSELSDIDINSTDVIIHMQVGKGAFGVVFGGEAKHNNHWEAVAIKLIQKEADYQGKIDFLNEARLMRDLEHENIVKLIGICLNPPKPVIYLVMELVVNGDLEDYLLSNRITARNDSSNRTVCPAKLTGFVRDIANGAQYLHEHNLLHRDLACRNCFLSEEDVVKIGDFGLTRKINESEEPRYYRVARHFVLPARWMPPEAVDLGYFSVQSDIWSLGVVIFEISTFCSRPYYNVSDDEIPDLVKSNSHALVGYLPPKAKGSEVYKLIDKCCKFNKEDRFENMQLIVDYLTDNPATIQAYLDYGPYTGFGLLSRNTTRLDSVHGGIFAGPSGMTAVEDIEPLSRHKSTSRSARSSLEHLGNLMAHPMALPDVPLLQFRHSHKTYQHSISNNCGFGSIMDDDTRRAFNAATVHSSGGGDGQGLTGTSSSKKNKKNKHRKKNRSNLNSVKSRSSDLSCSRLDDDQEHSYASCPDNQPITSLDIDPHDFQLTETAIQRLKSTSGDYKRHHQFANGASGTTPTSFYRHYGHKKSSFNHRMIGGDSRAQQFEASQPLLFTRNCNVHFHPEKMCNNSCTTRATAIDGELC